MEYKDKVIKDIINDINEEELLLPHFQRDFDWKPEKQQSLIASFLYDIPIGSILLLEAKTEMITKTIGYQKPHNIKKDKKTFYLMDGQQRLTTLKGVFDDFFKENTDEIFDKLYYPLKNRWFLKLEIFNKDKTIQEPNLRIILDLITEGEISDKRSVSDIKELITQQKIIKTKKKQFPPYHPHTIKNNPEIFESYLIKEQYIALFLLLSTTEKKKTQISQNYKNLLIEPTKKIFKNKWFNAIKNSEKKEKFKSILEEYEIFVDLDDPKQINSVSDQWANNIYDALRDFLTLERKLVAITYGDSFPKAVEAFTAMNRGGLPLSTFDIIVAKYAALNKPVLLKDRIENTFEEICKKNIEMLPNINTDKIYNQFSKDKDAETQGFYNLYLNMLGIFSANQDITLDCIKETKKLSLTKDDIDKNTDKAVISIALAFKFLSGYCGVPRINEISYHLMILPIAINLYNKYKKNINLKQKDILKILYWYWSSIFGGRYREKQNPRSIEDIDILYKLLNDKTTEEAKGKIEKIEKKVFEDENYSDLESLKNKETKSLEDPILQFIFSNKILNKNLDNCSDVVKELEKETFEKSHLISLNDFRQKTNKKLKRSAKHYINSVFNLALLPKLDNRLDYTKSWYFWNKNALKQYKILIPEKINSYNWDTFTIKAKDAKSKDWVKLCRLFIEARSEEIKNIVKKRLKDFEENWQ